MSALNTAEIVSVSRRRRRVPLVIAACLLVTGAVAAMAITGSLLAPHDPNAQNLAIALAKPSGAHWLGTDALGRDIFSRLIAGARMAVAGALAIAVGSMLLGDLLGLLAGFYGGRTDGWIMRWVDLMISIPALLVIIAVAGAVHGGYWFAVALLLVLAVPLDARVVRGATLAQARRPYVEAAKTLGVSKGRIMVHHIWPNVAAIAVANSFLVFAGAIVSLSALSFLGLGAPVGSPDWGLMVAENQSLLFANPVAALAPAAMIVLTVISMNLIGDWLYERLSSGEAR